MDNIYIHTRNEALKELELKEGFTEAELKKSWRKLISQHHPDRNPGDKEAEIKYKRANEAYDGLLNNTLPRQKVPPPQDVPGHQQGRSQAQQNFSERQRDRSSGTSFGSRVEDIFSYFGDIGGGFTFGDLGENFNDAIRNFQQAATDPHPFTDRRPDKITPSRPLKPEEINYILSHLTTEARQSAAEARGYEKFQGYYIPKEVTLEKAEGPTVTLRLGFQAGNPHLNNQIKLSLSYINPAVRDALARVDTKRDASPKEIKLNRKRIEHVIFNAFAHECIPDIVEKLYGPNYRADFRYGTGNAPDALYFQNIEHKEGPEAFAGLGDAVTPYDEKKDPAFGNGLSHGYRKYHVDLVKLTEILLETVPLVEKIQKVIDEAMRHSAESLASEVRLIGFDGKNAILRFDPLRAKSNIDALMAISKETGVTLIDPKLKKIKAKNYQDIMNVRVDAESLVMALAYYNNHSHDVGNKLRAEMQASQALKARA